MVAMTTCMTVTLIPISRSWSRTWPVRCLFLLPSVCPPSPPGVGAGGGGHAGHGPAGPGSLTSPWPAQTTWAASPHPARCVSLRQAYDCLAGAVSSQRDRLAVVVT